MDLAQVAGEEPADGSAVRRSKGSRFRGSARGSKGAARSLSTGRATTPVSSRLLIPTAWRRCFAISASLAPRVRVLEAGLLQRTMASPAYDRTAGWRSYRQSKIDRVSIAVEPVPFGNEIPPGLGAILLPLLGDRVAEKYQVGMGAAEFRELRQCRSRHHFRSRREIRVAARTSARVRGAAPRRRRGSRQERVWKVVTTGKRSGLKAGSCGILIGCVRKRRFRRRGKSAMSPAQCQRTSPRRAEFPDR